MKKEHEVYTVLKNINDETFKPELVLFQDAPGSGKSHGLAKVIAEDIQKDKYPDCKIKLNTLEK